MEILNPINHLFFLIEDGQVLAWNYKLHEQYLLEKEYFLELLNLSKTKQPGDKKISKELLDANLVTTSEIKASEWGWDLISKIYHIGTQNVGSKTYFKPDDFAHEYIDKCSKLKNTIPSSYSDKKGVLIDLPEPNITFFQDESFFSTIQNRKTCRSFNAEHITLEELSLILYGSFGIIHKNSPQSHENNFIQTQIRKATPSSGGVHSEEAYVFVYRVKNLDQGLYHYRLQDHKLTQITKGNFEEQVIGINYNQYFSKGMAFGVYITSRLDKIWWKYKHSRSYRMILLDIGHVSQQFLLCATALKLQTWLTGAFHDEEIENFLQITGTSEIPILYVGCGKGNNQSIPNNMLTDS